jgi:nucleotide-binding universal stress UspA family protein
MFDNILVPMDGSSLSELILPHAAAMARVYRSEVRLLSVMDPGLETLKSSFNGAYDWQIRRAEAKAYLDGIASSLKAAGIHTHPLLLEGNAPETILSHSAELGINLVMLSSHGERGISGWGMSSVPLKIIEHIPFAADITALRSDTARFAVVFSVGLTDGTLEDMTRSSNKLK